MSLFVHFPLLLYIGLSVSHFHSFLLLCSLSELQITFLPFRSLQAHPRKWEEVTIQLLRVATARIEDCDPLIEKHSFLCTPVLFDKEDEPGYFTLCEKTMQEQIDEFNQQLGVIHELDCTITDGDDDTEVKVKILQIDSEINYGNKM